MSGDSAIQFLIAIATSGVFGAIINGIINRRKLGAEATKIITDAAANVVSATERALIEYRAREEEWEAKERKWYKILRIHERWDHKMYNLAQTHNPELIIEEPTTLYPD